MTYDTASFVTVGACLMYLIQTGRHLYAVNAIINPKLINLKILLSFFT